MIDSFAKKFKEFADNENFDEFSEESKVALFCIYMNAIKPSGQPQPQVSAAPASSNSKIRKPNRPATVKQKGFITRLQHQGKLDADIDIDGISVIEASALIGQGMNAPVNPKPEPEEEKDGEFAGSYAHKSGGSSSSANFWE